jgi:DNA mismatch repair protein MutL
VKTKTIKQLPQHLIDQIKAGEVIENPAGLIKELVENSVDANATSINIHLIDGGMELISVEDDGDGMTLEDLPQAFMRHATSKLDRFEQLYQLASYGFRGEALASIASIGRVNCTSTPLNNEEGGKIEIDGGKQISLIPLRGDSSGTSIFIRDLFYNTPVRLKFIKSKTSEKGAIQRTIIAAILTNPDIKFSIQWDDRPRQIYPRLESNDYQQRMRSHLAEKLPELRQSLANGGDGNEQLILIDHSYESYRVWGLLSRSCSKGGRQKLSYLFANQRPFVDRSLHHTIVRSMGELWPAQHSGHYIVMLDIPASELDVNIHPNKIQLKFAQFSTVASIISAAIKASCRQVKIERPTFETKGSSTFSSDENSNPHFFPYGNSTTAQTNSIGLNQHYAQLPQPVSSNYYLLNSDHHSWLLDIRALLAQVLGQHLLLTDILPEAEITPLLISEPFELASDIELVEKWVIPLLTRRGFEMDYLGQEVFALRSIPTCLDMFATKPMVAPLINFLLDQRAASPPLEIIISGLYQHLDPQACQATPETISQLLQESYPNELWQSEPFSKKLDDLTLTRLFQSSPTKG